MKTADEYIDEFLVVHDTVGLQRTEIRNMLHAYGRMIGDEVKSECINWVAPCDMRLLKEQVNIDEFLK